MTDEFSSELPGELLDDVRLDCDEPLGSIRTHLSGWEKGQAVKNFL